MTSLTDILAYYQTTFRDKHFRPVEEETSDILMDVFGITPQMKADNRQYWGRELGMCWEKLVRALFTAAIEDVKPGFKIRHRTLCDLIVNDDLALDLKYRIGSGDSGAQTKWVMNGEHLTAMGFKPALLILREDNLITTIKAFERGGWAVMSGQTAFTFIEAWTGFDLQAWLRSQAGAFSITPVSVIRSADAQVESEFAVSA